MSQHRRRNRPGFIQVFEDDLLAIADSTDHPASLFLVWLAMCRLENEARIKDNDLSFQAPIRKIADRAGLRYRATAMALDQLETLGLVRVTRQFSDPKTRQPDGPSIFTIYGALRDFYV